MLSVQEEWAYLATISGGLAEDPPKGYWKRGNHGKGSKQAPRQKRLPHWDPFQGITEGGSLGSLGF